MELPERSAPSTSSKGNRWANHPGTLSTTLIGSAAEHLVLADLMMSGFTDVYQAVHGSPYDIMLVLGNNQLKIQVKATQAPVFLPEQKFPTYAWYIRRSKGINGRQLRGYSEDEVDVFAMVGMQSREVAYIPASEMKTRLRLQPSGNRKEWPLDGFRGRRSRYMDEFRFQHVVQKFYGIF